MTLFSKRWRLEHFLPRDPNVDEDVNHEPVHGDLLAFDSEVGTFVAATPPIQPGIGTVVTDGDLIWWDAVDAQLEPVSVLDAIDSAAAYGSILVQDGAAAEAVTGTAAKLASFAANGNASAFIVPDHTTDDLTVAVGGDGMYEVKCSLSFSYGAAAIVQFRVRNGVVETVLGGQAEVLNAGDVVNVSFGGFLALVATDVISVYVEANADNNITVIDAQLSVNRIGA